jgi:hypothetical protein
LERRGHGHRFLRCFDGETIAPSNGRQAVVKIPAFSFQEELGFYARHRDDVAIKLNYPVTDIVLFPSANKLAKSLHVFVWARCSTGTMKIRPRIRVDRDN